MTVRSCNGTATKIWLPERYDLLSDNFCLHGVALQAVSILIGYLCTAHPEVRVLLGVWTCPRISVLYEGCAISKLPSYALVAVYSVLYTVSITAKPEV